MWISELFHSIQGEGQHAGTPSVFVRTSGCNLRCWFCDTPYTSWQAEGEHHRWQDICEQVLAYDCEHVVLTGGEPFLQAELVPLTERLTDANRQITIETAGTFDRPVQADLISLSPKLSNSTPEEEPWHTRHEQRRDSPAVITRFLQDYNCQLKFVIDTPADLTDVLQYTDRYPQIRGEMVFLMPQARTREELTEKEPWLQELAHEHGFQVSPRIHIEKWGNVRGK